MKNFLWKGAFVAVLLGLGFSVSAATPVTQPGFQVQTVVTGLHLPTSMAFASDGRIFITEKSGSVREVKNGVLLTTPVITLSRVNDYSDHGLLGIALDPNFAQNGYMYLSYTYENTPGINYTGPKTGQIIRVTVVGDTANESSKLILAGSMVGDVNSPSCLNFPKTADCIASDAQTHSVGGLRFGPDGKLYATTGDGAGFNSVDPEALQALDVDVLAGKLLRMNPDGTAPTDNPFYNGDPQANRSKVWIYGLRNAYRFGFRPSTGTLYVSDVGWYSWEAMYLAKGGDNIGWPCVEGFATTTYNCSAPGHINPIYVYDHSQFGTAAITGAAFPTTAAYPSQYVNNILYFADYAGDFIKKMNLDANGKTLSVENFVDSAGGPVDILAGPDGALYYPSIYTGELRKVVYSSTNRPPSANASASPFSGPAPLTVTFSSNGSSDPDNDPLSYVWNFGDGATSTVANPQHTYTANGAYGVSLTVSDGKGGTNTKNIIVSVGNPPPTTVKPHMVSTTVSPTPTYIGRESLLTTTITNQGTPDPIIVDMEVFDSNLNLAARKFYEHQTIPTGGSQDFTLDWFPSAIGKYTVKVGLFAWDWSQLYEWNDQALVLDVLNRAPATTTTPFNPTYGGTTVTSTNAGGTSNVIEATVNNTGDAGSALVDIEVYKDVNKVGQYFVDNQNFAASETKKIDYTWNATTSGNYVVKVGIFKPAWAGIYSWTDAAGQITVGGSTSSAGAIYQDALATGWGNWSWGGAFDLASTDTVNEGSKSIKVAFNSPWAGLYLHNDHLDTTGKTNLLFALSGGTSGGQNLQIYAYDNAGNVIAVKNLSAYLPVGGLKPNTWNQVTIPLADLQSQNKVILGLVIQDAGGATQPTFYVDNVRVQ